MISNVPTIQLFRKVQIRFRLTPLHQSGFYFPVGMYPPGKLMPDPGIVYIGFGQSQQGRGSEFGLTEIENKADKGIKLILRKIQPYRIDRFFAFGNIRLQESPSLLPGYHITAFNAARVSITDCPFACRTQVGMRAEALMRLNQFNAPVTCFHLY